MSTYYNYPSSSNLLPSSKYNVAVPINLAKSLEGKYFVSSSANLIFGRETSAWARLYNPVNSGVFLHVAVWTVSNVSQSTYRAQVWFNSNPPGIPKKSSQVTPSNFALNPLPRPKTYLQYASAVPGNPTDGVKAYERIGQPESTMADDEEGKFIFPPGGSFLIFLSNPETPQLAAAGKIAFGWWEEPIH